MHVFIGREGLPPSVKKHKYWIQADADTFEYGSYREFMQLGKSITVVKK